jgi:predicted PurR-regulated permease PerM
VKKTRNLRDVAAICGLLAILAPPVTALAQTATPVNDQIKQLQNAIRNIQKQYQTQIQSLQKQLDDLKAAQAAPKPAPAPAPG